MAKHRTFQQLTYVERVAYYRDIKPTQHCTSEECPYTQSHTAQWCGYEQKRQCNCHWDYPERGQVKA